MMINKDTYKRMTEKTKGCFKYCLKDNKPKVGEFNDYDAFYNYSMAIMRLGELEDKIENGTLVELPCKVGDTIYFDTYRQGKRIGVQPHKVERIEVVVSTERPFGSAGAEIPEWQFGKTVFLTKEEAEAKLKELQEEEE